MKLDSNNTRNRLQSRRALGAATCIVLIALVAACTKSPEDITSTATGTIVTNITARATGGGSPFDGTIDEISDLEDLVETAWGDGDLDLHRGHAPIESVLEAFLGITHEEMHIYMEQQDLNLAGVCDTLGFAPENLIESLTASFSTFIREAADKGLIKTDEIPIWTERIRKAFSDRVHWNG